MNHRLCRIFQEVHVEKFLKINFFVCVAVLFEEKLTDWKVMDNAAVFGYFNRSSVLFQLCTEI